MTFESGHENWFCRYRIPDLPSPTFCPVPVTFWIPVPLETTASVENTSLNFVLYQVEEILLSRNSMDSLAEPNWSLRKFLMVFMKTFSKQSMLVLYQNVATAIVTGTNRNFGYIFQS